MVMACVVGAVHHHINFKFLMVMIAVYMINMTPSYVSCTFDQLTETLILESFHQNIDLVIGKAQIEITTNE